MKKELLDFITHFETVFEVKLNQREYDLIEYCFNEGYKIAMKNELSKVLQYVLAEYDGNIFCKNSKDTGYGYRECILNLENCKTCPKCKLDLELIKKDYGMK